MEKTEVLNRALKLAVQVALAAGERLRVEFFRPGGPRGHGSTADIDKEVEEEIRQALLAEFPEGSYRGEETGCLDHDSPIRWVVDPNDGTNSYLQGARGSSVSIGLLWQGLPVLGVVYAPLYPDNEGDLLAWAEGCGPATRNGTPLPYPTWPQELSAGDVVIVSQHGDHATSANLKCVSPARFRTMPSIAYRLALAAAGEAVAGVSLNGAVAHDFVAGHALLRGQGGVLLDQNGDPVVYDERGDAHPHFCFGGAPAVCRMLAQRPWGTVLGNAPSKGSFPVKEEKGRVTGDSRRLSRALGCWFGQLCGDSLGSLVEFQTPASIAAAYPDGPRLLRDGGTWNTLAGQPTDDSELALCLARSLIDNHGFDRSATLTAYRSWLTSPPFDIGATTRAGLSSDHPYSDSQANGALMRCSPLALSGWSNLEQVMAWSDQDASITHPHTTCLQANRAFLRALVAGLNGADPQQMHQAALKDAQGAVLETLQRAEQQAPADFVHQMGWVLLALQNAFHRLLHSRNLEEGVVETVRGGGDTDTNGCIAGALLGAAYGVRAIPEQWRLAVLSCRPHEDFAAARQRRPSFCWPVDAYQVTERLLAIQP